MFGNGTSCEDLEPETLSISLLQFFGGSNEELFCLLLVIRQSRRAIRVLRARGQQESRNGPGRGLTTAGTA
jgi:hypothetical protein